MGGLESDDSVGGRRPANGTTGVGPHPELSKGGGDGRTGASARPGRGALEIVRVERLQAHRAETLGYCALGRDRRRRSGNAAATTGPLTEIDLRDNDGAGVPKFFHHKG